MYLHLVANTSKSDKNKLQIIFYASLNRIISGKEELSPIYLNETLQDTGTFFFAPLRAVLTVEAAIVLPIFLFVMIAVMQYVNVMETAVKFGASLSDTGKLIAASAYVSRYGGDTDGVPELAAGALSAVYAQSRVTAQASDTSAVKNINMALSSFLQEDEAIDLVLTYQIRSSISIVKLPSHFFIQRARVRAWTGRTPSLNGGEEDEEGTGGDYVYVTETGSVYHEDMECTYLKLSIREVDISALGMLRNNSGGIYHSCEKCGGMSEDGRVYITNEGDRYHNSLSCSGLKRSVRQVAREELGSLRACSKCGKE
jgi:hypothetical protein